jgi:hypothetical protein
MNKLLRNFGIGLMVLGVILILIWAIKPLRMVWPWLLQLPLPLKVGVVIGTLGLVVLLGAMITERIGEREADQSLRDEL